MSTIKIWLQCGIIELLRLILFIGVIVFAAGLGLILYKIYESHFNNAYMLETIPYLLECIGYLVGVYFLDKCLIKHLMRVRQSIKNT